MKKLITMVLCLAMFGTLMAACGSSSSTASTSTSATSAASSSAEATSAEATSAESTSAEATSDAENTTHKIGITIQSLENDYWAGVFGVMEQILTAQGWDYTLVDCDDTPSEQISQIENFVAAGCEFIMVHPSDPDSIEDACAAAREAGVKVMCWDDIMENVDANWVLDNTSLGYYIATPAAEFINENYSEDNKAEVCVIGYPQTPILLERANGMKQALEELCPGKYEIVAEIDGLVATEAQTNVETVLQAHPDCKVFVTIGAGSDIGANEALITNYNAAIPADCAIFSGDATYIQLEAIAARAAEIEAGNETFAEASYCTTGFEGSSALTAEACFDMYCKVIEATEQFATDNTVYRPFVNIDITNVHDYLDTYETIDEEYLVPGYRPADLNG